MIILGIDPGSNRIGYSIIKKNGRLQLVKAGVIEIKSGDRSLKFMTIADKLKSIIKKYHPDLAAIEMIFFSKNQKTVMEVAGAIGVTTYIIAREKIPLREYTPSQIKKAITGFGMADKGSVAKMSCLLLNIEEIPGPDDISDSIAIAITAAHHKYQEG